VAIAYTVALITSVGIMDERTGKHPFTLVIGGDVDEDGISALPKSKHRPFESYVCSLFSPCFLF
jgi:hypothetical protein